MNVLHIISDTFRRDNLLTYGGRAHTPSLDAFAERCVIFDKAYVCSFPTVPVRGELVTGQVGFCRRGWEPLQRDVPVIADAMAEKGIVSMMIADTPHHLKDGFFYNRGFTGWEWIRGQETDCRFTQPYDFDAPAIRKRRAYTRPHSERLPPGLERHLRNIEFRRGEEDTFVAQTMTAAMRWLEQNYLHHSFYLMVDTFDPHEPWDPPEWYVRRFDPEDYDGPEPIYPPYGPNPMDGRTTRRARDLYRAEASLVDTWVGMLLRKVENMGLLENTMVVFMSDHGFLLGEHDLMGKNFDMYEEVIHIPLLIYHPEATPHRSNALVTIPEVPATVLDALGVSAPSTVEGRSVLPVLRGETDNVREYAVSHGAYRGGWSPDGGKPHGAVTDGEWSLLLNSDSPPDKLFHLSEDPSQNDNRFESDSEHARRLYGAFLDFVTAHGGGEQMAEHFRRRAAQLAP